MIFTAACLLSTALQLTTKYFFILRTNLSPHRYKIYKPTQTTDWLTDWLTDRQTDWLTDWQTDKQTDTERQDWHSIVYECLQPNHISKVRWSDSQNNRWNLHVNYILLPTSVLIGFPLWTDSWYRVSKSDGHTHLTKHFIWLVAKVTGINTNKLTKS